MLRLVGEEGAELPLVGEREVKLGISHTVSGNPTASTPAPSSSNRTGPGPRR
jgi:hypothetical protein